MKRSAWFGLGIMIGLSIPFFFVWVIIRLYAYVFRKFKELETSGIRVMATVTRIDELKVRSISIGDTSYPRRKHYRLIAQWREPRRGKVYTLKSTILNPTKFPVGSEVAFLVNARHPGWWHRLENWREALTREK